MSIVVFSNGSDDAASSKISKPTDVESKFAFNGSHKQTASKITRIKEEEEEKIDVETISNHSCSEDNESMLQQMDTSHESKPSDEKNNTIADESVTEKQSSSPNRSKNEALNYSIEKLTKHPKLRFKVK